jgi:hypothetical protein
LNTPPDEPAEMSATPVICVAPRLVEFTFVEFVVDEFIVVTVPVVPLIVEHVTVFNDELVLTDKFAVLTAELLLIVVEFSVVVFTVGTERLPDTLILAKDALVPVNVVIVAELTVAELVTDKLGVVALLEMFNVTTFAVAIVAKFVTVIFGVVACVVILALLTVKLVSITAVFALKL